MKRILIASILALFLYGCNKDPMQAGFNIEAITSEANKSSFFDYSIKLPTLGGSSELTSFNKILREGINQEKDALEKEARESQSTEGFIPYQYYVDYKIASSSLLHSNSLLVTTYSYMGGANGSERFQSYSFIDGKEMTWSTIFTDTVELIVVALVNDQLDQDDLLPMNQKNYFSNAKIDSLEGISWYLDGNMLCLAFPLFSVAPHSAGIVHMAFPLNDLIDQGAVKPAFTPVSKENLG